MRRRLLLIVVLSAVVFTTVRVAPAAAADRWDPRVEDLARTVERLRGLAFEHPVPVRVLGDRAFGARLEGDDSPGRRARAEWDQLQTILRAVGLTEAPIDLEEVWSEARADVLGFYDPASKAIVVRGSTLDDPATRVVLAHELTHALQDQHFGLGALSARAARADSLLTRALVEGDASRIEEMYSESLERSAGPDRAGDDGPGAPSADETPSALPAIFDVMFQAPYVLGYDATRALHTAGGRRGLDEVMRRPPLRDLGLVDPSALVGRPEWRAVAAPDLDAGDVRVGTPVPFDALLLYLVLGDGLSWTDALSAAERWGGDRSVAFTRAGRPCVRVHIAGRDGGADATALVDAFRRWAVARGPAADVDAEVEAGQARVTICDQADLDAPATVSPGRSLVGLVVRNELVVGFVRADVPIGVARCGADVLVRTPEATAMVGSVADLDDDVPDERAADFRATIRAQAADAVMECQLARRRS